MIKRILCLLLVTVLAFGAAACGSRPVQEMEQAVESALPTMDPAHETRMPAETPEVSQEPDLLDVSEVLDAIREAKPEELGTPVMTYVAAVQVLTFCAEGGAQQPGFEQDVKAWIDRLGGEDREQFIASARAVAELSERIAQGDVEQSELEENLSGSDTDWEHFDPVNFQHENLQRFVDVVTSALEG